MIERVFLWGFLGGGEVLCSLSLGVGGRVRERERALCLGSLADVPVCKLLPYSYYGIRKYFGSRQQAARFSCKKAAGNYDVLNKLLTYGWRNCMRCGTSENM